MRLLKRIKKFLLPQFEVRFLRNEVGKHQEQIEVLRGQILQLSSFLPAYGDKLRQLFTCLQPMQAVGIPKVRIGTKTDGGYVMLDDLKNVPLAFSLGIGYEASWDMDMALKGIRVEQFDPTVDRAPQSNPLLHFHKRAVEKISELCGSGDAERRVLKIDIEGAEWPLLDDASEAELQQFDQITGEFHRFDQYGEKEWFERTERVLQKLNRTHQLIHIHGNNYSTDFWTGKTYLPVHLELTFASRKRYTFTATQEPFPGALDFPCNPNRPDPVIDCKSI